MITVDCRDVTSIQNDLVAYVSDQVAAIPTLKHHEFVLSSFDEDDEIDTGVVITSIKEFLDSIGEGHNFAVISNSSMISIKSLSGKKIVREKEPVPEMFSCTHCGYVTRYEVDYQNHVKIHYL